MRAIRRGRAPAAGRALAVALALAMGGPGAAGYVQVMEGTLEFGPFRDFEARFGPPLPALGLEARILLAEPAHGCTPLKNRPGHRWVALIERSPGRDYPAYPTRPDWPDYAKEPECKFIDKVQNAEAAGAAAVIIYDNLPGEMFIMAKPYDAPEPRIPAVSISKASGLLIKGVLEGPHTIPPFVLIMPDPAGWASLISVVMAGVLCMSLVVGFFFYRQHQLIQLAAMPLPGRPSRQGMAKKDIEALPLVRYTGPEPGDEDRDDSLCVICLDDYEPDELLRMLPCRHKFHRKCIDKWLMTQSLCPLCKGDARDFFKASDECTPLLAPRLGPDAEAPSPGGAGASTSYSEGSEIPSETRIEVADSDLESEPELDPEPADGPAPGEAAAAPPGAVRRL